MRKKVYYVRFESNEFVDAQVWASSKKEATEIADNNLHLPQGFGNSFEVGEVSPTPLNAFSDQLAIDEKNPIEIEQ